MSDFLGKRLQFRLGSTPPSPVVRKSLASLFAASPREPDFGVLLKRKLAPKKDPPTKRYVLAHEGAVAIKIKTVLAAWRLKFAKAIAAKVKAEKRDARLAALLMYKADERTPEQIVQDILDQLDAEGFAVELVDAVRDDLEEAMRAGGLSGLDLIDLANDRALVNLVNEGAVDWAGERAAALVTMIEDSTRDMLRSDVTEALQEGWSVEDLADALQEGAAFSDARAEMIARTELANAHVQGNLSAWDDSGVVSGKQWILADTHPHEDECDEAADEGTIDLDDDFAATDSSGPPAHPNCLCDVLPVLAAEEEEQQ